MPVTSASMSSAEALAGAASASLTRLLPTVSRADAMGSPIAFLARIDDPDVSMAAAAGPAGIKWCNACMSSNGRISLADSATAESDRDRVEMTSTKKPSLSASNVSALCFANNSMFRHTLSSNVRA